MVEQVRRNLFTWAFRYYDNVYVNPKNVIVVPSGTTSVFVETRELQDGRVHISTRAPILMNLEGSPRLFEYVAINCGNFTLGSLYLFREGGRYDLDFECRLLSTWLSEQDFLEIIAISGESARNLSAELQPNLGGNVLNNDEGPPVPQVFGDVTAYPEVSDKLGQSLDGETVIVIGVATSVRRIPENYELTGAVYAVTPTDFWAAGRTGRRNAIEVMRVPHRDVKRDIIHEPAVYMAELKTKSFIWVTLADLVAARAILVVRNES